MAAEMKESDWKTFRILREIALERYCERVLSEAGRLAAEPGKTAHDRYLMMYRLMKDRDHHLADMFNDSRRSNALLQLAYIRRDGLLNDQEFGRISSDAQEAVRRILSL